MKSLVVITITLFVSVSAIADTDTLMKSKFHIQIGLTNMNFIDGYGFNTSDNNYIFSIFYPKFNYSINYKINKKGSIDLTYHFYTLHSYYKLRGQNEISGSNNGDLLSKAKGIIGLGYSHYFISPLKRNLNFYFSPNTSALYSFGADHIFLYDYPYGFDFASVGVENKGFGVGVGTEVGLIAFKHFSLSLSLNYNYIFERGKYEEFMPEYYKYTPSRNILTFQPKIGFLF